MESKWIKDMFTKPPKDDSKSTKEDIFAPNEPDWAEEAEKGVTLEELYHKTAKQYSIGAFGELTKKQQDSADYYLGKQWDSSPSYGIETPTVDLKFKGTSPQWDETASLTQLGKVGAMEKATNPNWTSGKPVDDLTYKKMKAAKEAYFKYYSNNKLVTSPTPNVYPTQPIPPLSSGDFLISSQGKLTWNPETTNDKASLELPVVWTFASATNVITVCQASSAQFGYHVCLGGSVLNKMESTKDLDLYFLPMSNYQVKEDPAGLLNWIHMNLGVVESINDSYPGKELPFILKGKLKYNGNASQRIDVFILGTAEQASLVKLEPAVEIDLSEDNVDHLKKGTPVEEWDIPF